jgi:hypothetical protein
MDKISLLDRQLSRLKNLFVEGYLGEDQFIQMTDKTLDLFERTSENASQTVREGELLCENGLVQPPDNAVA